MMPLANGQRISTRTVTEDSTVQHLQRVALSTSPPGSALRKALRTVAASAEMAVDGSVTPVEFYYQVAAGQRLDLSELRLMLFDGAAVEPHLFGGIAALTNGLQILVTDGAAPEVTLLDLTDTTRIKINADLALVGDLDILSGSGADIVSARIPCNLRLSALSKVKIIVNDNLTGLDRFRVLAIGDLST